MPAIHLDLNGEGAWSDLAECMAKPCTTGEADGLRICALPGGMSSGAPSVAIRLDFPDGSARVVQTSLALFLSTADALRARFGDPRK